MCENNKITGFYEECLINLFSYYLFRHNKFHNKKNLINNMNSITNEKINQLKQKLIKETNNIIYFIPEN